MSSSPPRRSLRAPIGTGVLAVLTATPGVHLAERWLAPVPALVVSHAAAVGLLALAVAQWRVRRTGLPGPASPAA